MCTGGRYIRLKLSNGIGEYRFHCFIGLFTVVQKDERQELGDGIGALGFLDPSVECGGANVVIGLLRQFLMLYVLVFSNTAFSPGVKASTCTHCGGSLDSSRSYARRSGENISRRGLAEGCSHNNGRFSQGKVLYLR